MTKDKLTAIVKSMGELDSAFQQFNSVMSQGPASFYFDKILGYYKGCMAASKFKVGNRVTLKENYSGDASGWAHCKHFLTKDSPATVEDVDYHNGKYYYDLSFDKETWIDSKGKLNPVSKKHTFCFAQSDIEKLKKC